MEQKVINFIYDNFKKSISTKRNIMIYREEIAKEKVVEIDNIKIEVNNDETKNELDSNEVNIELDSAEIKNSPDKEEKIEIVKEIGYQEVREFLESFKLSDGLNHNRTVFLNSIYYLYFNKLMTVDQECDFIKFLYKKYSRGFPDFAITLYTRKLLLAESKKTIFEIIVEIFNKVLDLSSLNHFPPKQDELDTIVYSYFKEVFEYIRKSFLAKDNLGYEKSDIRILVYLYYAIAFNTGLLDFDYYLDFERAFLENYGNVSRNKAKENLGQFIPFYLTKTTTKSMGSLCYLYYGSMGKITYLENLNKNTDKTNNILRTSIHQKDEEISLLQNKIKNLNSLLIEKDNSIEKYQKDIDDLQKEVEIQKGKTEYTKTILNQQMDTLEDDIKNEIMSRVKIELESIYDISTILDEKNAQRIQRRLKQINKVFNK